MNLSSLQLEPPIAFFFLPSPIATHRWLNFQLEQLPITNNSEPITSNCSRRLASRLGNSKTARQGAFDARHARPASNAKEHTEPPFSPSSTIRHWHGPLLLRPGHIPPHSSGHAAATAARPRGLQRVPGTNLASAASPAEVRAKHLANARAFPQHHGCRREVLLDRLRREGGERDEGNQCRDSPASESSTAHESPQVRTMAFTLTTNSRRRISDFLHCRCRMK